MKPLNMDLVSSRFADLGMRVSKEKLKKIWKTKNETMRKRKRRGRRSTKEGKARMKISSM